MLGLLRSRASDLRGFIEIFIIIMKCKGSSCKPSIEVNFAQDAFRASAFVRRRIACSDCSTKVKGVRKAFGYPFELFSLRWVRGIRRCWLERNAHLSAGLRTCDKLQSRGWLSEANPEVRRPRT